MEITCCECGIKFNIPDNYYRERRKCHNTFCCPNGHKLFFPDKTEEERTIEKLKDEVKYYKERMNFYMGRETDLIRSRAYYKGKLTALKRRI